MDLCNDVDTHLARTIPRICATYKFDAQIHGNVRRCGAGLRCDIWDQPTSLDKKLAGSPDDLKRTVQLIERAGVSV